MIGLTVFTGGRMTVRDLLFAKGREVVTIHPEKSLRTAMGLMIEYHIGSLPVVFIDGALVGIVTERDIFRFMHHSRGDMSHAIVADVMTQEVIVGIPDDSVEYIAKVITQNRIRHIPIVENSRLVGLVSIGDVVKARLEDVTATNRYLMEYINGGPMFEAWQ